MPVQIVSLTGPAMQTALPDLARLRIDVFRKWPYLYDGALAYEERYLARFAATERSVIVAAYDGQTIIGAATASPIGGHVPEFSEPLAACGLPVGRIFYFGESVLLPGYRGQGIGHAFFDHREAHARSFPEYQFASFCAVVRRDDHPLRDPDYRPLDSFWNKRGYFPLARRHQLVRLEGHRARRGEAEGHAVLDQGALGEGLLGVPNDSMNAASA